MSFTHHHQVATPTTQDVMVNDTSGAANEQEEETTTTNNTNHHSSSGSIPIRHVNNMHLNSSTTTITITTAALDDDEGGDLFADEDKFSRTPDWISEHHHNHHHQQYSHNYHQYSKHGHVDDDLDNPFHDDDDERPSSPSWASHEDVFPNDHDIEDEDEDNRIILVHGDTDLTNSSSSSIIRSMISSPNNSSSNNNNNSSSSNNNITVMDNTSSSSSFSHHQIITSASSGHHMSTVYQDYDFEEDDEDEDSEETALQPELYSEEFDDAVHLSETHLFRPILKANIEKRKIGIMNVIEIIRQHAELYNNTQQQPTTQINKDNEEEGAEEVSVSGGGGGGSGGNEPNNRLNPVKFFSFYRSIIARFAYDSPFTDISSRFKELVEELRNRGIPMPKAEYNFLNAPSFFFTPLGLATIDCNEPLVEKHFKTFFVEDGIVSHLARVLMVFPDFSEIFYKAYHFAMRRDGPLPVAWRHYIAIMAASRHHCNYLIRRQEVEFLNNGGDPKWLRGVRFIPQKLASLLELNAILAHCPWMLRKEHVERLVKPTASIQDYSALWSIAELVHAVVIMCHFHALSGFVFGCGLLPDDDTTPVGEVIDDIRKFKLYKKQLEMNTDQKLSEENAKVLQTLNKISIEESGVPQKPILLDERNNEERSESPPARKEKAPVIGCPPVLDYNNFDCFNNPRYASLMYWATLPSTSPTGGPSDDVSASIDMRKKRLSSNDYRVYQRYMAIGDEEVVSTGEKLIDMRYSDFDVRRKDYSVLFAQEYNWKSDCFPLLNRFYNGYADLLDQEFDFIRNMTENNFYKAQNVDTTAFRMAIWLYVQRLYGVLQDDYDYQRVNVLLNIGLKKYVKTVVCYPERTEREQFVDMGFQFKTREKIHVNMLAMEARKQMSLVYALKQIQNQHIH